MIDSSPKLFCATVGLGAEKGAHRTVVKLISEGKMSPMVLAMPSDGLWGDGSAYNAHDGYDFEKWIVEDVPVAVLENVPQVTSCSPQFISGLSMGGLGR